MNHGNTNIILSLFSPASSVLKTLIEGTESPRHSSLIEAIKVEKIENEWKFPFQGGLGSQDYFHSSVEGGGSRYSISSVKSPVSQMDDVVLSMITKFF